MTNTIGGKTDTLTLTDTLGIQMNTIPTQKKQVLSTLKLSEIQITKLVK